MTKTILSLTSLAMIAAIAGVPAAVRGADAPTTAPSTMPSAAGADQAGAAKFYGTISAVDPAAKTFTIDGQTYSVIGETHMSKAADDSLATLADAVVGEPARGSYTKSSDGKMNVTKVRFGKKTGGKSGGGKSGGGGKKKDAEAATQPAN